MIEAPWKREVSLDPAGVAQLRAQQVKGALEVYGMAVAAFTCDGCADVGDCWIAFDLYNTDGDCLYEK